MLRKYFKKKKGFKDKISYRVAGAYFTMYKKYVFL